MDALTIVVKSSGITQADRDLNKLGNSAAVTEKKVLSLVAAVDKMVKQFATSTSGVQAMTQALSVVNKSTQASDAALKSLSSSVAASNSVMKALADSVGLLQKEMGVLNTRLQQSGTNVNNSTKHIVHHTKAMTDAHAAARGLSGSLGALWLTYGSAVPLAAGAAIGASLKSIITIGADVENTLEAIRLKGEATTAEMAEMRKAVTDIGQGVYGPQQVTEAFQTLVLAGLKAKEAVTAVGAALNLATSGGTTIEKSAEALVTIGTAVGATAQQYDFLADGIQKAANISLASVDSIAESVKRASVVNKLYGASFEDILTQTAALAQLGIKNSAAGTAITNFYANALGGTEKARKALDQLGFSFQDATGKAKPLVDAFEEFTVKLNQFDLKSQQKIITDIFGERALRDVEGLRDQVNSLANDTGKYANKLRETQGEIANAAGTSAVLAAQQALTTENQFKAVGNTLKSTFVEAFDSIGPAANNIAKILKQAFASEEFKTSLNNIVAGFGKLAEFLAKNIPVLTAVAEGFIAVSIATAGGALFSRMIPAVQGLAVAFGAVTVAANGAAVATGAFGTAIKLIPGIGIALGLVTAAYALYSIHADKAAKSTKELAEEKRKLSEEYTTDLFGNLDKEIERLTAVNEQLDKGVELTEAQHRANTKLALSKVQAVNQEAVDVARKAVDEAKKDPQLLSFIGQLEAKKRLLAATNALAAAEKKMQEDNEAFAKRQEKINLLAGFQKSILAARTLGKELEAEGKAGTKTFTEVDKNATKQLSFLEQERLHLKQLVAQYDAKTKAIMDGYKIGQLVAADSQQAIVMVNNAEKKYANEKIYLQELALAKAADEAKLRHQQAVEYVEIGQKISNVLEAEKHRQAVAEQGDISGKLEGQIVASAKLAGITGELLERDILRARQADLINKQIDQRNKLESATKSSEQRAEQYADELAILEKYGVAVKQTAVEFAKAEIAKRGFTESSAEGQARMGAAGVEDLNKALLELQKTYMGLQQWQESQNNQLLESVLGVETAKVEIYKQTAEKAIEFEKARGMAAIEAQKAAGKISEGEAQSQLDKLTNQLTKVKGLLGDKLKIDFKIAGLKDISTIFDKLADNAGKLGRGFAGASKALGGYSNAFKTLAQAEQEHGQNESKMQTARIGFYGDMADASKNFFAENTAGYKTLDGVAKIFHAAQLARTFAESAALAVEAVLNQAQGDPYTAWGRMAAMAAVVATLGFAVGGGFNSSAGGETAEQRQERQGTGSIFGDSKGKSASIANSLELLEKNSDLTLPLTQGMLAALKNIEASMAGLANLVVRSDIASGANFSGSTGSSIGGGALGGLAVSTSKLFGGIGPMGDIMGSIASAILGKTTKSIIDSGLMFGGKVSDLQQGQGFSQFANIETTKKSLFGLVKRTSSNVETKALNDEVSKQFGLIFTNLEVALKSAAGGFGKSGEDIGNVIANTVLETTKLSLKDLKGEELTQAIQAVISKAMDDISMAAFPGLDDFRQVGEGYAQTVIRVSSGIEQANVALEKFNINAISYVDIVNKQGDVAAEIFKQSVLAVEQFDGVRNIVKNLTGDVSELVATYSQLKDIQTQLTNIGLSGGNLSVDTIKGAGGLDELQEGLQDFFDNILTEEQQLAIKTSNLSKEFANLGYSVPISKTAFADLVKSVDDGSVAGNRLVGQLLQLSRAFAEVEDATKEMIRQAKESAMEAAMGQVDAAFKALQNSVNAQKKMLKEQYDVQIAAIKAAGEARKKAAQVELDAAKQNLQAITAIYNSLSSAMKSTQVETAALTKARRESAIDFLNSIRGTDLTKSSEGINNALEALSKPSEQMFSTLEEYTLNQAMAAEAVGGLRNQASVQKTFAELTIERLEGIIETIEKQTQDQLAAAEAYYEAELEKLDKIIESAQSQIDALNGVATAIQSLIGALTSFRGAIAGATGQGVANAGGGNINPELGIASIYQSLLGRTPDKGGLDFYLDAYMNKGVSLTDIAADIAKSTEGQAYMLKVPSFDVGTNSVPYDMLANVHAGERIVPAADNAELMRRLDSGDSNSASNREAINILNEIKTVIMSGDLATNQKLSEMLKIEKRWDTDGLPPERTVV